jgi:hypothetical protein
MSNAALETSTSAMIDAKFTAAQIERNCPSRLQEIGREIGERLKKAERQYKKGDEQASAIKALLTEAKGLCDDGGFKKFHELFCSHLRKSRGYELLAIASDKKSIEEIRASTRKRVAKHRVNKAAGAKSVTVTEKSEQLALSAPTEDEEADTTAALVPEQMPQSTKPRSAIATGDRALRLFTSLVMELVRTTRNKEVERFAKTAVTADDLARLGKFLTRIASLKKSRAVTPTPDLPDEGTLSAGAFVALRAAGPLVSIATEDTCP